MDQFEGQLTAQEVARVKHLFVSPALGKQKQGQCSKAALEALYCEGMEGVFADLPLALKHGELSTVVKAHEWEEFFRSIKEVRGPKALCFALEALEGKVAGQRAPKQAKGKSPSKGKSKKVEKSTEVGAGTLCARNHVVVL